MAQTKKTTEKTIKKRLEFVFSKLRKYVCYALIFFFVSTVFTVIIYRFIPVYATPLMFIRSVEQLFGDDKLSMKKEWVSIDEISPNMINAVVASEDNNFMLHFGFDFDAIEKAKKRNKKGSRVYGASTITQQTAKNVFLWPKRSWVRKGLETYFTLLIEIFWSKERIMEVYLNVIETGKGIYGVQRASQIYFDKSAAKLTQSQAALIAGSLPNPRRFSPKAPSAYLYKRQNQIIKLMGLIGNTDLKKRW